MYAKVFWSFFSKKDCFLTYCFLSVIVTLPYLTAHVPAFGDTLNHLARMHILAAIGHAPELQRYYEVHWSPIPYLAMDVLIPPLLRVLPIYVVGKLFVVVCVLMPAVATIVLHRVVHGRSSLVPAAAFLLCGNYLLALGFLNYLFTAGLAVLLFAAWLACAGWPRWRRAALFAGPLLLLYFGHAYGALAYCLCVAGTDAARAWRTARTNWRAALLDVAAAAAQAIPAMLFAATLDLGQGYVGALNTQYGNWAVKLLAFASPVLLLLDFTHVASALLALMLLLAWHRHVHVSPGVWPACLAVGLGALAMPHVLASTWGMDYRLPLVFAMVTIGGLSVRLPRALRGPMLAAFVCLLAWRSADTWTALRAIDAEIEQTRALLSQLPRGARLLVVDAQPLSTGRERITSSTAWHMPLTAVIDRDAFVPYLFNGLTTIRIRPAYRLSSTPNGLPITPDQWRQGATGRDDGREHGNGLGAREYYLGWPEKFDDVLVIKHGGDPGPVPPGLRVMSATPGMVLYSVAGT